MKFQSKPFLDPQRSIFNRFRRTGALSPSQRLYSTVPKGHGHSGIDKIRLSRSSRVRDLARTHLWVITRRTLQTKIHSQRALEASIVYRALRPQGPWYWHRAFQRLSAPRNEWMTSEWRLGPAADKIISQKNKIFLQCRLSAVGLPCEQEQRSRRFHTYFSPQTIGPTVRIPKSGSTMKQKLMDQEFTTQCKTYCRTNRLKVIR